MKESAHLILDNQGESILRNLSISSKKWTNLITDLSELCDNSSVKEATHHLIEQSFDIIKLKSSYTYTKEIFDETETKRIMKGLNQLQTIQNQSKSNRVLNQNLFNDMISQISDNENDKDLMKALNLISYINLKHERRKSFKNNKQPVALHNNFATELINFIEYSIESNNLSTFLILLKVLLCLKDRKRSTDIKSITNLIKSTSIMDSLSTHSVLDIADLKKISSIEEIKEHLLTFDSNPRILLCNGNPTKLSTYELQGKALGFINGVSIKPFSGQQYYEVALKGRGFVGMKIGWCLCGSNLPQSSNNNNQLGNPIDNWVFEGFSGHFFHNALEISKTNDSHIDETNNSGIGDNDDEDTLFANLFSEDSATNKSNQVNSSIQLEQETVPANGDLDIVNADVKELLSKRTLLDQDKLIDNNNISENKKLETNFVKHTSIKAGGSLLLNLEGKETAPNEYSWSAGSIIGCLFSSDTGEMSFFIEGKYIGSAPVTIPTEMFMNCGICPVFSCNPSAGIEINIGQGSFKFESQVIAHIQERKNYALNNKLTRDLFEDEAEIKRLNESDLRQQLSLMNSKCKGYLSLMQPTFVDKTSLDATGSGILIENFSSDSFKALTFETSLRISRKYTSGEEIKEQVILSCGPTPDSVNIVQIVGSTDDYACIFGIDSEGCLFFEIAAGERVKSPICNLKHECWYHVAVSFSYHRSSNKATVCFMLNGVQISQHELLSTKKSKIGKISPRYMCIGGKYQSLTQLENTTPQPGAVNISPNNGFQGDICEVRIWSVSRSAERILSLLGRGKVSGVELDLLALFPLEESCGRIVHDAAIVKNAVRPINTISLVGNYRWATIPLNPEGESYLDFISLSYTDSAALSESSKECVVDASTFLITENPFDSPKRNHTDRNDFDCIDSLIAGISVKFIVACDKFLTTYSTNINSSLLKKLKSSMPQIKSILDPCELNLLLINSLLRQLLVISNKIRVNDEFHTLELLFSSVLKALFAILRVNMKSIIDSQIPTNSPASILESDLSKSEVFNSLLITLLNFVSGCKLSSIDQIESIRKDAAKTIISGIDTFIPLKSNQLYALECLVLKRSLKMKDRFYNSNCIHQEIFTFLTSLQSNDLSSMNALSLKTDPLLAWLSMSDAGDELLLSSLCTLIGSTSFITEIFPKNFRPAVIPAVDSISAWNLKSGYVPISSEDIIPTPGDRVQRGPNWNYGDQDGGLGSIGIVIEIGKWMHEIRNNSDSSEFSKVTVQWKNGNINSYRYGALVPVDSELIHTKVFDLLVLRPSRKANEKPSNQNLISNAAAISTTANTVSIKVDSYPRVSLSYSMDEVILALNENKTGSSPITKRSIISYMKEIAPLEWQEKFSLLKSVNNLLTKLNSNEISRIYNEFYRTFSDTCDSLNPPPTNKLKIEPRSVSKSRNSNEKHFQERFLMIISVLLNDFQHIENYESSCFESFQYLLTSIHSVMIGLYDSIDNQNSIIDKDFYFVDLAKVEKRIIRSYFYGKTGDLLNWDWQKGLWGKVAKVDSGSEKISYSTDSVANHDSSKGKPIVKILTDLTIDKNYLGGNLLIKNRIRSVEITQSGDREWNTCICTTALHPFTGIYKWYVKIKSFSERRGHCMLGVATIDFSYDEFLGQHQDSWGLSPNLELFHGGRKRKTDSERKLAIGCIIEVTVDTNKGTINFSELSMDENTQTIEPLGFENVRGVVLYPAFSLYSPGDCISIFTNIEDIKSLRSKDGISSVQGGEHVSITVSKNRVVMLGSPQPIVMRYCLELINVSIKILKSTDPSSFVHLNKNPVLSVFLLQLLSSLSKWTTIPKADSKPIVDALIKLLESLRTGIDMIREYSLTVANEEHKEIQESDELLVQLTCITTIYLGYIAKTWIKEKPFLFDNENQSIGRFDQELSLDNLGKVARVNQFLESNDEDAQQWLSNIIFSNGFQPKTPNEFLRIALNSDSYFELFVKWISLHDKTHKNYQRFGGDILLNPVKILFAVNVYHSGYLECTTYLHSQFIEFVKEMIAGGDAINDEVLLALKPPFYLLYNWETAMKIRVWAKELVNTGLSYEFVGNHILRKCNFLLQAEPSSAEQLYEKRSDVDFSKWLNQFQLETNRSYMFHNIEQHLQNITNSTKKFVMSKINIDYLKEAVRMNTRKAESRRDGFKAIRAALGHISENIGCGAKCALIANLPPVIKTISDSTTLDASHYLEGLPGITQSLRLEMQGSFDSYYACVTEELGSCNYAEDCVYQLCLLDCLGIRLLEQDHTMLSRVNFFFTLQEILDNSLVLISDSVVTPVTTNISKTDIECSNPNKIVVKATMKLFILMALQVATCRDDEISLSNNSFGYQSHTSSSQGSSNEFYAPTLRKTKSGPATLSKSVFDILFSQLDEVSKSVLSRAKSLQCAEYFLPTVFISQSADLITSETTTLLLCISKNSVCQKILCRPKWLILLLQMAVLSTSLCQQRAIILLRDLLVTTDASQIDLSGFEKSSLPVNFSSCFSKPASSANLLVNILLTLIGNMFLNIGINPVVCAENTDFLKEITELALPVISETIALVRSLYLSNLWHDVVELFITSTINKSIEITQKELHSDLILSKHLIAIFCVLGGQIQAPYRNCPVIFQTSLSSASNGNQEFKIGTFVDFQDSGEKMQLSYFKSDDDVNTSGSNLNVSNFLIPSTIILPVDKVHVINRCPIEKLSLSKEMVLLLLQFMNKYVLGERFSNESLAPMIVPTAEPKIIESKEEGILKDSKEESYDLISSSLFMDCSFTSNFNQLLTSACTRVVSLLASNSSSVDVLLDVLNNFNESPTFLYTLLDQAQEPNKSGGLSDLGVTEEYLMIAMRQRQKLWANHKQTQHIDSIKKKSDVMKETISKELNLKDRSSMSLTSEQRPLDSNASDAATEFGSICGSNFAENKTSERSMSPLPPLPPPRRNGVHALLLNREHPLSEQWQQESDDHVDEAYEFSSYNEGEDETHNYLVDSLCNMGFPTRWCELALDMCGGDPEEALNYILSNSNQLEEMASSMEGDESEEAAETDIQIQEPSESINNSNLERCTSKNHNDQETIKDDKILFSLESAANLSIESTVKQEIVLNNVQTGHYDSSCNKLLAFYANPDFESERLGCIYPGDDITILESVPDSKVPTNTWFKLAYSDYEDHYNSGYSEDISNVFVWIPKIFDGIEVIKEGNCQYDLETELANPPGQSIIIDKFYKIIGSNGALAREGVEISSSEILSIKTGEIVHACEETFNSEGTLRLRIDKPICGWISKFHGLVQHILNENAVQIKEYKSLIVSEDAKKDKTSELELLNMIDDNMEVFTANDAFNRSDRFFGAMQGSQYIKFRDREKALSQSLYTRRMRVSGMSSYHSYSQGLSNQSLRSADVCILSLLEILKKLYCRRLLLCLFIRNTRNVMNLQTIPSIQKCSIFNQMLNKVENSSLKVDFVHKFYRFIRFVVFRGEPYSYTGVETLGFSDLFSAFVEEETISIEQVIDKSVWTIIRKNENFDATEENLYFRKKFIETLLESIAKNIRLAAAPRFSDHVWPDTTYEEDLDNDILDQPNLHYICWITRILLLLDDDDLSISLCKYWVLGLRASSLSMKHNVFNILSEILSKVKSSPFALEACLSLLPIERLITLSAKRLWSEMEDSPSFSRFLQALLQLLAMVNISKLSLQQKPLYDTDIDQQISFSNRLKSDEKDISVEVSNRSVIHFKEFDSSTGLNSYIQLNPQKEVSGPWTVEFWLCRKNVDNSNLSSYSSPASPVKSDKLIDNDREGGENDSLHRRLAATLGFSDSIDHVNDVLRSELMNAAGEIGRESKIGITGLLNLLLGSSTTRDSLSSKSKPSQSKKSITVPSEEGKPILNPCCLLSSSKGSIKIQAGGRVFGVSKEISIVPIPEFEDPLQYSDPVHEEAYCVSIAPAGATEKKFDCVIPSDRWIHLSLVCQVIPSSTITLYVDGIAQDVIATNMSLPLSIIGSVTGGTSFCGEIAEMRVWNIARSKLEIQRDMNADVTNSKNLISHLKFSEGIGKLTHDKLGIFNSCKLNNCDWLRVSLPKLRCNNNPSFMIYDSEEAEGLFATEIGSGAKVIEMTGVLKIQAIFGAQGEFANDSSEVVSVCYREISESSTTNVVLIEGYLDWCERDVRSKISGSISDQGLILFTIVPNSVLLGPPENLEWLHNLQFEGNIIDAQFVGKLSIAAIIDTLPAVDPGCSRIDQYSLPSVVKYLGSVRSNVLAHLVVKENVPDGQYVVTAELAPYSFMNKRIKSNNKTIHVDRLDNLTQEIESLSQTSAINRALSCSSVLSAEEDNVDQLRSLEVDTFGICADQGSLWIEWLLNSNSGNISFGLCSSDALIHPDACVDANDDTWTYSTEGQASNGSNLSLCNIAEEGDKISIHVDTDKGLVNFYKNYEFLVGFEGLNAHPKMKCINPNPPYSTELNLLPIEESFKPGVRPFVNLVSAGDSVSYLGLKEGKIDIKFGEEDVLLRKKFYCQLVQGNFHGFGLTTFNSSALNIFGNWYYGYEDGIHIEVNSDTDVVVTAKKFECGEFIEELNIITTSSEVTVLLDEYKKFIEERLTVINGTNTNVVVADEGNTTSETKSSSNVQRMSDTIRADALAAQFAQVQSSSKITVVLHDSSGENSYFKVMRGIVAKKLFAAYATKRDIPVTSFVFKYGSTVIDPARTIESYRINNNAIIEVTVHSVNAVTSKGLQSKTEIENFIIESTAPFVLQIIYEAGALVRSGVEIESTSLRTLSHGEIIEAFGKSYSSEGVGRYHIADGWISEKLRGGSEAMVVRILKEKYATPLYYKVIREEGARIRESPSLNSADIGFCPLNTVITASESRYIPSGLIESENNTTSTIRIKITSPANWQGWASVKDHILERTTSPDSTTTGGEHSIVSLDPAVIAEKERRVRIRTQRKTKYETKTKQAASKNRKKLVQASGNLDVSEETFFLLKRRNRTGSSGSAQISPDFTSVKCDSSSHGRSMVLGSRGFTKGVHYWEVQVNAASWGSIFIGVAPGESSSWNGYGLLNYRATQAFGSETLYGSYFSVNDKVGVLLDMDHGTISFFKDGEDFNLGRVSVINMGVAYHNLRRMGIRSSHSILYPCFGVKMNGDELSIRKQHWVSSKGLSSTSLLQRYLQAKHILYDWNEAYKFSDSRINSHLIRKTYEAYQVWGNPDTLEITSRPGILVKVSINDKAVEKSVGNKLIKDYNIKAGKLVKTPYGSGKILGARKNQLWYCYEGGEHCAWYWRIDELQDLINSGAIKFNDTEVLISPDNSDSNLMNYDSFMENIQQTSWSLEEDAQICKVVNYLVNKHDMDPFRISANEIKKYIISNNILSNKPYGAIQARYASLCVLNKAASIVLPLVDFNDGDNRLPIVSTTITEFNICSFSPTTNTNKLVWSSGFLIQQIKKVIFTQTKMSFWNIAIKESTTPTAAPADEYERPDDLREININRVEAKNIEKNKENMKFSDKLKISVFGQLLTSMSSWDERSFRRAYVHMQDAGQSRAFFVKFTGEGVDDQGGPYRAVFQTAVGEESVKLLDLLIPCENANADIGDNRDKYIFNPILSNSFKNSSVYIHLGRLIALACRHHILVPLSLPKLIWKPLVGEEVSIHDLQAIDISVINSLNAISQCFDSKSKDMITSNNNLTIDHIAELLIQALSNSSSSLPGSIATAQNIVSKILGAEKDLNNKEINNMINSIVELIQQLYLTSQSKGLKYIYKGISAIVPVELLSMFTSDELENIFCGEAEVDITTLQRATIYENVSPNDSHIQYFWEALQLLNQEERSQLINFCSGRSRLPISASDYSMYFKLTSSPTHSEKNPDDYLPIARTCFFSLSLPKYSSVNICLEKLKYAIRNTELMDADFIDRKGTSGWENIR